jgi:ABC-type multidrug transport system fused ATPase/permease subunit
MARFRSRNDSDDKDLPKVKISLRALREAAQLYRYLLPYWPKFLAALVTLMLGSGMGLVLPFISGTLVDGALKRFTHPKEVAFQPWYDSVDAIAVGLLVVLACQAACLFMQTMWFAEVGGRSLTDLRRDAYARLIRLPMAFHMQRKVGEWASRLASDLAEIQETIVMLVPQFLRQCIMLIGCVVLIALTSLRLTLVMLASLPVLIVIAIIFGRFIRRNSRDTQDRLAESNVIVEETLQGVAVVKAFANEGYEETRYRGGLDRVLAAVLRTAKYRGAFVSFIVFVLLGAVVCVLWYGARMVFAGQLTAGELTRFMMYTMFVVGAMSSFAEIYSSIQRALGATHRVRDLLSETPESLEPPVPTPSSNGDVKRRLRGEVVFEHVAFTYPSRPDVEVLHDVSLSAASGQRIALVGPSGAGKSTIVTLLLRFYEPSRGRILIDGRDARDYALHDLRNQTAIVPQDVLLFGRSIGENIAYGKPGATDAEIIDAARKANAHDFIMAFPEGYKTQVGERGVQLSGGQRQRVAIARAILRDPAILILDEATSSLDSESESLVLQALETLMAGRTSIIIAHRLSTVRGADRIYVVKDGATVEQGTHAELIARPDGIYRMLSELQQLDLAPTE